MEQKVSIIENMRNESKVDNFMKVVILSKSENEKLARNIVASFLIEKNPSVELVSDVKTAVSEAVTNCIVHGYQGNQGEIRIETKLKGKDLYIKIEDDGVGIKDITQAMQPFYTTGKEGERSGMGFTVMDTFMDELEVRNGMERGVVVEMAKKIKCTDAE